MRVLVAMEDQHVAYREVITDALRFLRPNLKVYSASTLKLYDEVAREVPHLVICDRAVPEIPGAWLSWIYLSLSPDRPSEVDVCGSRSETTNPGLGELLLVIEHTEKALAEGPEEQRIARQHDFSLSTQRRRE